MGASVARFACTQPRQRLRVLFPSDLPRLWVTAAKCSAPAFFFSSPFFSQGDLTHTCTDTFATHREEETDNGRCEAAVAAGNTFPIKAFSSSSSCKQRGFFWALSITGSSRWHPDQSRRRRQKKDNAHWQDTPLPQSTPTQHEQQSKQSRKKRDRDGWERPTQTLEVRRLQMSPPVHEGSGCGLPNCCWLQLWSQASLPIPEVMWFLFDGAL